MKQSPVSAPLKAALIVLVGFIIVSPTRGGAEPNTPQRTLGVPNVGTSGGYIVTDATITEVVKPYKVTAKAKETIVWHIYNLGEKPFYVEFVKFRKPKPDGKDPGCVEGVDCLDPRGVLSKAFPKTRVNGHSSITFSADAGDLGTGRNPFKYDIRISSLDGKLTQDFEPDLVIEKP